MLPSLAIVCICFAYSNGQAADPLDIELKNQYDKGRGSASSVHRLLAGKYKFNVFSLYNFKIAATSMHIFICRFIRTCAQP